MQKNSYIKKTIKAGIVISIALALLLPSSVAITNIEKTIKNDDLAGSKDGWSDNFDSYTTGQFLDGGPDDGGWKGWDDNPSNGAYVDDEQYISSPNSVEVLNLVDLVHEFEGYNTGIWTFSAWTYIPTGFSGESYFILLDEYVDGGGQDLNHWAIQLRLDSALGKVESEHNGGNTNLIYDQWVEIRVEIDLMADWMELYYNDVILEDKEWTAGVNNDYTGNLNIAAVDLFANGASIVYYDDISLEGNLNPLIADANGPYEGAVGYPVQFDGEASGGTPPYTYHWDFGDEVGESTEEDPEYTYDAEGDYTVVFTVTDDEGKAVAVDETTCSVIEIEPLTADANGPYDAEVGEEIEFSGSADGGVPPYTYEWDFGNGDTSDEQNPVYTYDAAGEYDVVLTITDSQKEIATDETTATIVDVAEFEITSVSGGLGINAVITNVGDGEALNAVAGMTVFGGILGLIDVDIETDPDDIDVDAEISLSSGMILGLGSVDIEIEANADNADKVKQDYSALVIGPIVIGVSEA